MDQNNCNLCLVKKQTMIHMLMLPDKIKVDLDFIQNIYTLVREKVNNMESDALCERCTKDLNIVETFRSSCLHSDKLITQISTNIADNHRILLGDVFIDVTLYEGLDEFYVSPLNVVEKSSMPMGPPPSPPPPPPPPAVHTQQHDMYNEDIVYDPHPDMMDTETAMVSPSKRVVQVRAIKKEPKVVFKCNKCKKQYSTIASLDMHRYKFHKGPNPNDVSSRRLKVEPASEKDIYYNVDITTTCEYCFTECASPAELKSHLSTVHPHFPRTYTCKACSKELKTKDTLRAHFLMVHSEDRPEFTCSYCDKTFFHKRSLQNHTAQHLGVHAGKFICDICGLKSSSRGDLNKHKLRHQKIKEHACQYDNCGKR